MKNTPNRIIIQGGLNGAISSKATFNISSTFKNSYNKNLVFIKGAIPGARNGLLYISKQ